MKRRILISLAMGLALAFSFSQMFFAQSAEGSVSAEDFIARMQIVCDKYGVEMQVSAVDSAVTRTEHDVAEVLAQMEEVFSAAQEITYVEAFESPGLARWEYTKTYTAYDYASNSPGTGATIEIKCDATIYDGYVTFQKISNITTRQYGIATGFKSWTQISSNSSIASDKKTATVEATGTLVTEMSLLGVTTTYTYDHTIGMVIRAS